MNPSRGPQVVAHQQEQKRVATHLRHSDIPPRHGDGPADKGRIQKRDRRDQHESLVRSAIEPIAEAKINQRREDQHVRAGDCVKGLDPHSRFARRKVPCQAIRGSHEAENDHETR